MASETRTRYHYPSLRNPKGIRVLKILDQNLGDVPCCSLTEVELDRQSSYIALSYSWGSPGKEATERGVTAERCNQIFCENCIIPVTQNPSDFLRDVRRFHRHLLEEFIWIDAVCIDQDNLSERAGQVKMMGDIYMQAKSVVIWLGRAEQTTPLALEFITVIENKEIPLVNARIDNPQPLGKFLGPLADSDDHWNALKLMLQRTWFLRIWVLQEFCLAVHLSLLCGQYEISIDKFSKAASLSLRFFPTSRPSEFIDLPGNRMMDILRLKKGMKERSPGNLFNILLYSSSSTATDPKDMVYGVLGMIKRSISDASPLQSMEVNYRLSTAEIYTKFTRLLVSEDPRLLLFQNHDPHLQGYAKFQLKLPSWVPNYANGLNVAHGDFAFKPSNDAAKALPPAPLVVRRPDGLVLNAQKVDVIEDRVVTYNGVYEDSWIARTLPDILRFLCAFKPVYFDGQPRSQALWLTLASGVIKADLRTAPALEIYRPIFGLWVGECLLTLAANDLGTYFRILMELWGPIGKLAQSEMDFFPNFTMLVEFPKVRTPQKDVSLAREKFRNMMKEPSNISHQVLFRTRAGLLGKSTKNVRKGDEKPTGKVHAAEVTRRKERQTSALPPPEPPKSGVRPSQTKSGRYHRRRAARGGGFNSDSDSDSDDDERRGNPQGGDGAVPGRRPPPSRQEMDFSQQIPSLDRLMQAFLSFFEKKIARSVPLAKQTKQQIQLLHDIPASERPMDDTILRHVDKLNSDLFEENLLAFTNLTSTASTDTDAVKSGLREMLQSGRIWCEYVTVSNKVPEYAFMLAEWMSPRFWTHPSRFVYM
ncbi:heterokaryon incompatibility protein-domain-containing protein [Aspergillus cavernicola]|uniref:Heterokaryon incompatibility protein-domain-containing protein n=1 Tax=Aspergillus cavernicola TaxID=176166 RepID=A0ABR4HR65_9EURO